MTTEERRSCPDCDHDDPHTTPVDGQYIRCGTCIRAGRDAYTLCTRFQRGYLPVERKAAIQREQAKASSP